MAVGVPETDVFAAADAVLARGERPTVERVRLELGRGSPARVGTLLDQWWEQLAQRLRGETRLPGLPAEVAQAFVAVWQQASVLAQGVVEHSVAAQREVLAAEYERVAGVEEQVRRDIALARRQVIEAETARGNAETRLDDLDKLLAQRQVQIEDLQQQRIELQGARSELQADIASLQQALRDQQQQAEHNRLAQEAYVRGVEERSHREVDRAREDLKTRNLEAREQQKQLEALQKRLEQTRSALGDAQLQAAAREARSQLAAEQGQHALQQLETQLRSAREAQEAALQAATAQQARADTLEQQLIQQLALKPRRSRAKKPDPAPGG
ncbi:DNA-binding protein [Pseudomonas sp. CFBP 8770]|uniref:DNA-binding protein n=1 Tax=unclassified Pseudomonas TaxID=196821 RepID=UPI001787289B|nr:MULTISPECIES: DNA-binding protein [unclassified Pseudomonas]MBD8472509.1 DNA-binding protein [Pseudomonas sp. CFBP 8773]MBD8649298.1 DNA-binding protein [Pseudomonas sp. CFBP 8770]